MGTAELEHVVLSPKPDRDERQAQLYTKELAPPRIGVRYLARECATAAPLLLADVVSVAFATWVATHLSALFGWTVGVSSLEALAASLCLVVPVFFLVGLYPAVGWSPTFELRLTAITLTIVLCVAQTAALLVDSPEPGLPQLFLLSWLFAVPAAPLARGFVRTVCSRWTWWGQPALIFGETVEASRVYDHLHKHPRLGLRPVGVMRAPRGGLSQTRPHLGPPEYASIVAYHGSVYWGVIAVAGQSREEVTHDIERCARGLPHLLVVPDLNGLSGVWLRGHGLPGIIVHERLLLPLPRMLKRVIDLVATVLGGILILPLIAGLAVAVKATSRGPLFFGQERLGLGGRKFKAWKFRTMVPDADKALQDHLAAHPESRREWERDHKLKNDPRVTSIGRLLRKTSLDELPQLWNVLRGDMSLAGPRPIVQDEIVKYGDSYAIYTRVRPGITGLWQVSGRNDISYAERVQIDTYYVRNWSPWMDLYILGSTIRVVLLRSGAY